jgi:hypothetical protein
MSSSSSVGGGAFAVGFGIAFVFALSIGGALNAGTPGTVPALTNGHDGGASFTAMGFLSLSSSLDLLVNVESTCVGLLPSL